MCSALVLAHGLKKEIYSFVVRLFRLMEIKERDILICSAPVSAHGLKNEVFSCVERLFRFMD